MGECNNNSNKKRHTIQYYDEKWDKYDHKKIMTRIQNAKPLLEKILNLVDFKSQMTILDIGTGPGTLPIALMERFNEHFPFKIYGIDPSPVSISIATEMIKDLNLQRRIAFKIGSFENIPFPENFFNLITSNASFNLCTNKIKAISEISRVIRKDGQVIIADCFKKDQNPLCVNDSEKLWAVCISGAITTKWFINNASSKDFVLTRQEDVTEIVKSLVLSDKWHWKEFIEYDLDYNIMKFGVQKKGE